MLAARDRLVANLSQPQLTTPPPLPPHVPNPLTLWQTLFVARLDPYIATTVSRLLRRPAAGPDGGMPGHVYVFRDDRDGPDVYKIGSTTRDPQRRIAEWRRQLTTTNDGDGSVVHLLFSQRVPRVRTAEAVVHMLFFCAWLPRRIDIRTGRRLMEYFRIDDVAALRLLLRGLALYLERAQT